MKALFSMLLIAFSNTFACDISSLVYSDFTTKENPSEISKQYMRIGESYCSSHGGLNLFGVYECPKTGFEIIYLCKNEKAFLFGGKKSTFPYKKIFTSS